MSNPVCGFVNPVGIYCDLPKGHPEEHGRLLDTPGYSEFQYSSIAAGVVDEVRAEMYRFHRENLDNKKPLTSDWGLPKEKVEEFEAHLQSAIKDRLKFLNMERLIANTELYLSIDEKYQGERVRAYFATVEDVYRFMGWYSAILGFYKESAKARVSVRM
jgi:hypothetical protein